MENLEKIEIFKNLLSYHNIIVEGVHFSTNNTPEGNKILIERHETTKVGGMPRRFEYTVGYFDTAWEAAEAIYTAVKFLKEEVEEND